MKTILVSLCVALVLYSTLVAGIDGQHTLSAMRRLDVLGWGLILGLSLFNYALRFLRWHIYLRWLGYRLPVGRHAIIYLSGFALTTTPGKAGENLRAVYLARYGVPYVHSLAAFFAERFIDLLAIALLSMLAVVAFSGYALWVVAPLAALAVLLLMIRQRRLLVLARRHVSDPQTPIQRLAHAAVSAWDRAFALLAWKPLYQGLVLGLVAWGAEGVSLYVIGQRLGLELALEPAVGIYAVAILIGALSFIPGGLGSTEAVMTLLLKLSGIGAYTALAITLIARIATLWFAVALGLICLAIQQFDRYVGMTVAASSTSDRSSR